MKMNKLMAAALALAVGGMTSSAASAATVTAGQGDLILGFQASSGTGASTNLEVDLGSYLNFTSTSLSTTLTQLNVNDLTSTYGANWASDGLVTWSVAGVATSTTDPIFDLTSTTVPRVASSSLLDGPFGLIQALSTGLNGQTATANSGSASEIGTSSSPASADSQSYTSLEANAAGPGYGYDADAESKGAPTQMELYGFAPGAKVNGKYPYATDLGTFSLSSDGVLTFTGSAAAVAAAPEPSTYALMAGAMGLLFLAMRRRRSLVD